MKQRQTKQNTHTHTAILKEQTTPLQRTQKKQYNDNTKQHKDKHKQNKHIQNKSNDEE